MELSIEYQYCWLWRFLITWSAPEFEIGFYDVDCETKLFCVIFRRANTACRRQGRAADHYCQSYTALAPNANRYPVPKIGERIEVGYNPPPIVKEVVYNFDLNCVLVIIDGPMLSQ